MERVKKIRDYAFVHFAQREDAVNAMNALNGKVIYWFVYLCQIWFLDILIFSMFSL